MKVVESIEKQLKRRRKKSLASLLSVGLFALLFVLAVTLRFGSKFISLSKHKLK